MSTVIRAGGPARFLSLVPHLLGFVPSRSLVLIPFGGGRSIGAMRFDLPEDPPAEEIDRFASTCIGMVCRLPEADAVTLVAYPDAQLRQTATGLPRQDLIDAVARRADACGIELRDALCVARDAWASYLDLETPPRLRDLSDIAPRDETGLPPLSEGDQATGAELPPVAPALIESTAEALSAIGDVVQALREDAPMDPLTSGDATAVGGGGAPRKRKHLDPRALTAACRLDELPTLFEDALGWKTTALDPFDAAVLVWCLSRPALRDIALVQWCGDRRDGDAALEAQLRWEDGADYPADLGMRMWGEGARPDLARLHGALELVRHAAALAPAEVRPGPLALCGWLSWALGRSTHAESFARRACELDPEHGLGEIVRSFVAVGHLPDWAFRPDRGERAAPATGRRRPKGRR